MNCVPNRRSTWMSILGLAMLLMCVWINIHASVFSTNAAARRLPAAQLSSVSILAQKIVCTNQEAADQVDAFRTEYFAQEKIGRHAWLGCPTDTIWDAFHDISPDRAKVMIDVGANKAYSLARFIETWNPGSNFTSRRVFDNILRASKESLSELSTLDSAHQKEATKWWSNSFFNSAQEGRLNSAHCGACNDCESKPVKSAVPISKNDGPTVYAFEPQVPTYRLLVDTAKRLGYKHLHLFNIAVSNFSGTARFIADPRGGCHEPGVEGCHLELPHRPTWVANAGPPKDMNWVDVQVTTIDQLREQHKLDHVWLLKIDTEGFDPLVLAGAKKTLAEKRVSVLQFEYSDYNLWQDVYKLEPVAKELDQHGYDCYITAGVSNVRITGCWQPGLDLKSEYWTSRVHHKPTGNFHGNCICINREEKALNLEMLRRCSWLPISLSQLAQRQGSALSTPDGTAASSSARGQVQSGSDLKHMVDSLEEVLAKMDRK